MGKGGAGGGGRERMNEGERRGRERESGEEGIDLKKGGGEGGR